MHADRGNLLLLALCLATISVGFSQRSLMTDDTYHAGVVEFPLLEGTVNQRTSAAANDFISIIESNDAADLDILVFPEYVLNGLDTATYVPDPKLNISPCVSPDYDTFFVELSCAVRSRGIYVLLNVLEKQKCGKDLGDPTLNPCPASGVQYFNTNVVFDRQGRVIARYRKTHLWRNEYYSRAVLQTPDVVTFTTDFGVTFGTFICFDMLFYEPALKLVRELNITDIIYSTYWFSELPFLTAVQLQEGWAFANNVNLLAADGSKPETRTTGSGIYAGRAGRLIAAIYENSTKILLKARLPKRRANGVPVAELPAEVLPLFQPRQVTPRYTKLGLFRDYNVDLFSTELLPSDFRSEQRRLCHKPSEFCCEFDVARQFSGLPSDHSAYRYRLAAYFGDETTFIRVDRSEQAVCALFACTDAELASCGRIFPGSIQVANEYYFSAINVSAIFPAAPRRLIMPSTVDGVMLPLPVAQYSWTEKQGPSGNTSVQMVLTAPKNDLLTFGIWANYYTELPSLHNLDHMHPGSSSTGTGGSPNANGTTNGTGVAAVSAFLSTFALFLTGFVMLLC